MHIKGCGVGLDSVLDLFESVTVLGLTLLVLADPLHEVSLFLLLFLDDSEVLEGESLTLPLLPTIC